MRKTLLSLMLLPALSYAECGSVTIADMGWDSASLTAGIDEFILENGYGCRARISKSSGEVSTGYGLMYRGNPQVIPEFWSSPILEELENAAADEKVAFAGSPLSDGGEEGFWIPSYMAENNPNLLSIEGIAAQPMMFNRKFYTCPADWNCYITSMNLFRALRLDTAGFVPVIPKNGAELAASISDAYEYKKPWFGYYWSPTAVLGKYPMDMVDFGTGIDDALYEFCITKDDCDAPRATMYPSSRVDTLVSGEFAKDNPEIMAYFADRSFTNKQMNSLLAWIDLQDASSTEALEFFFKNYDNLWKAWLPEDVARDVQKAVDRM